VHDAGSREVRARDEAHEWAQTRSSQGACEKEAGHVGFKVMIQNGGTGNHLEIRAQGRREIGEASQIEAESRSANDMVRRLGDCSARGRAQLEFDAVARCRGTKELVAEEHRHSAFNSFA
jgi:hypothetical protein